MHLPGLGADVEVLTDRWGVPHIHAANEWDLYVAQGFVAARARLFQMDLQRRKGLGDDAAEVEWSAEAFVTGVNAFVDLCQDREDLLPYEFRELDYRPGRWHAKDLSRHEASESNTWVIGSTRTCSGRPILASDPRRETTLPSAYFLTHLVAPGINVIGAGEPHLPGISIGHNGSVAFSTQVQASPVEDSIVTTNDRIREMLANDTQWTVADCLALQVDELNPRARKLVPILLAAMGRPVDPVVRRAVELLRAWDFVESADAAAPAVFNTWLRRHTPEDDLRSTFEDAVAELVTNHGRRPEAWRWGDLHTVTFAHPIEGMGLPPIPRGGSGGSASLRIVIDVGAWDESVAVNAPGQSGNPDSEHYDDHIDAWSRGAAFPLSYSRAAVVRAAESRLVLRPVTDERSTLS